MSITVKRNLVEQTINLEELFGTTFKRKKELREAIAERAIQMMQERVEDGVGVKFASNGSARQYDLNSIPYSKEYVNSLDFAAFGKSKGEVNLRLKGDMLELIDIKKQTSDTITLGWTDKLENKKAYAHTVGKSGDSKVTVPARPFFGLTKSDLKQLVREFKSEVEDDGEN